MPSLSVQIPLVLESSDEQDLWPQKAHSLLGGGCVEDSMLIALTGVGRFIRPGAHSLIAVCYVCFQMFCSNHHSSD